MDEMYLILKLKEGDHDAFQKIYHLYKRKLLVNILKLVKARELAEELVQELFVKLWENRDHVDPAKSISSYLYKIANNLIYDNFRRASRDQKLFDQLLEQADQGYYHIEEQIYLRENRELLYHAIDQMPAKQKKVFIMCKLEEKSYAEVSSELGISVGTINVHIKRSNIFLKNFFDKNPGMAIVIILPGIMSIFQ